MTVVRMGMKRRQEMKVTFPTPKNLHSFYLSIITNSSSSFATSIRADASRCRYRFSPTSKSRGAL